MRQQRGENPDDVLRCVVSHVLSSGGAEVAHKFGKGVWIRVPTERCTWQCDEMAGIVVGS